MSRALVIAVLSLLCGCIDWSTADTSYCNVHILNREPGICGYDPTVVGPAPAVRGAWTVGGSGHDTVRAIASGGGKTWIAGTVDSGERAFLAEVTEDGPGPLHRIEGSGQSVSGDLALAPDGSLLWVLQVTNGPVTLFDGTVLAASALIHLDADLHVLGVRPLAPMPSAALAVGASEVVLSGNYSGSLTYDGEDRAPGRPFGVALVAFSFDLAYRWSFAGGGCGYEAAYSAAADADGSWWWHVASYTCDFGGTQLGDSNGGLATAILAHVAPPATAGASASLIEAVLEPRAQDFAGDITRAYPRPVRTVAAGEGGVAWSRADYGTTYGVGFVSDVRWNGDEEQWGVHTYSPASARDVTGRLFAANAAWLGGYGSYAGEAPRFIGTPPKPSILGRHGFVLSHSIDPSKSWLRLFLARSRTEDIDVSSVATDAQGRLWVAGDFTDSVQSGDLRLDSAGGADGFVFLLDAPAQ